MTKKMPKSSSRKIWIFFLLFIVLGVISFMALFTSYKSTSDGYNFLRLRDWKVARYDGLYFNGLLISQDDLTDSSDSYEKGGFIQIISEGDVAGSSVQEYLENLKKKDQEHVANGNPPVVPGSSQYEYVGGEGIFLNDFKRVGSLSAFPDDPNSLLYWKIDNDRLIQIFIKYPSDNSKRANFELGMRSLLATFKASQIDKQYSSIEVYSADKKISLGFITIVDNKIVNSVKEKEVSNFIEENRNLWETTTLSYDANEYEKNGTSKNIEKLTKIGDTNHIISIYTNLDNEFNSRFYFDLIGSIY